MARWIMIVLLCGLAIVDIQRRRIPNRLAYGLIPIGCIVGTMEVGFRGMLLGTVGAIAVGLFLFLIHATGGADVKIEIALGAAFGAVGFLDGMVCSVLAAGVIGVFLVGRALVAGRCDIMGMRGAFVPYLTVGFAIALIV